MGSAVPAGVTRVSPSPPPHGRCSRGPAGGARCPPVAAERGQGPGGTGGTGGNRGELRWTGLGCTGLVRAGLHWSDRTGLYWAVLVHEGHCSAGLDWSLDWDSFLPPVPPAPSAAGWDKSRGHIATG